jgi:hypothetical protein
MFVLFINGQNLIPNSDSVHQTDSEGKETRMCKRAFISTKCWCLQLVEIHLHVSYTRYWYGS